MNAADASLATAISAEESARIADVDAEESRAMAAEAALDVRLDDIEGNYLDKRANAPAQSVDSVVNFNNDVSLNGYTTLPGATFDPYGNITLAPVSQLVVVDSALNVTGETTLGGNMTVNGSTIMSGSVKVGANQLEIVPVVTVVETSGAGDYEDISTMFGDLASFTGMVMANFQVVADGGGKGMAGEDRVSAQCNGGQLLVLSVVELAQDLLGGAMLDVNFLTDGKVRVMNDGQEGGTFKWHVQRVKMVAVNTSGAVK